MSYHDEEFVYDNKASYDLNFSVWFRMVNAERINYREPTYSYEHGYERFQEMYNMEEKMGALKAYMNDIHDSCIDVGVKETAKKFKLSDEEVRNTTMVWAGFDGTWEEFVSFAPDDWKQ